MGICICYCRPFPPVVSSPSWRREHVPRNAVLSVPLHLEAPPNSKSASVKQMPYWKMVWFSCVEFYFILGVIQLSSINICIILMYRWSGWRLLFVLPCPVPGNGGHQHGQYHALLLPGWGLFKYLHGFLTQHGLLLWICIPSGGHSHTLVHSCIIIVLLHW